MATKQEILKKITAVGKAVSKVVGMIQETAVDCVLHAVEHGDVTLADKLMEACGKGVRRQSLSGWFEKNGPMYLPRGAKVFALDKERAKAMRKEDQAELREALMALPWQEAVKEPEVVSILDVGAEFDKFLKRLQKQASEVGMNVKHRELLTLVARDVARYQAEQILADDGEDDAVTTTVGKSAPEERTDAKGTAPRDIPAVSKVH